MIIVGHRGAKEEWPENTLLGINKAIDCGVEGIEIDVRKSKDGELVVIHDRSIDRTTDKSGNVEDLTFAEIQNLDAGQGEKVPRLRDVLQLTMDKGVHLFIECKLHDIENEINELISEMDAYDHCTVICFHHYMVKNLKDLNPKIDCGCLIVGTPIDPVTMVKNADASKLIINIFTVDQRLVDQCHSENVQIAVWNVNSVDDLKRMNALGVDYLMTDYPSRISKKVL